ncbi:MAG: hypothetical protein ACK4L4_12485 [Gemmobacter sp.]
MMCRGCPRRPARGSASIARKRHASINFRQRCRIRQCRNGAVAPLEAALVDGGDLAEVSDRVFSRDTEAAIIAFQAETTFRTPAVRTVNFLRRLGIFTRSAFAGC